MSLRTRLLLALAVLVLAAVASSGWLILTVTRSRVVAVEESRAAVVGRQVASVLERVGDLSKPATDVSRRPQLIRAAAELVNAAVVEEIVIRGPRDEPVVGVLGPDGRLAGALGGMRFAIRDGNDVFYYAPLESGGAVRGAVRLKLSSLDDLTAALGGAWKLLVATTLVDVALIVLFGALFIRRVIGPLEAVTAQANRVAAGEIELPPLPLPVGDRGDELARLTDDFNRMTASLRQQRDTLLAQEKLATVGRLAAGVAHEVGNPLAAVLGYVELLLSDEPPGSERRDLLERVHKETQRITTIIRDLLDYSRPIGDEVEPVSLSTVVDGAVSLLKPQARFRGVTVRSEVGPTTPQVRASSSRLTQVFINLLLNAADAMNGEGSVRITAVTDEKSVELRFTDSGPGVRPEDRGRIFDPFFTTKEPGQGTGLGLAICRSIVQAYGGELRLDSQAEPGATFTVKLQRI